MPNIKSQIKRVETAKKANSTNSALKSEARTYIKKVEALVAEGKKEEAVAALSKAISFLDKLAGKGIYARNTVNRKKAHLQKRVASR